MDFRKKINSIKHHYFFKFILFITFGISCQEIPNIPVRDNVNDTKAINFGIKISRPINNTTIVDTITIKIKSKFVSTQYNLDHLNIYLNDSLIAQSVNIPFNFPFDFSTYKKGASTIRCTAHSKDGGYIQDSVMVFNSPFSLEILESNDLLLTWNFGIPIKKYEIYRSRKKDMSNSELVTIVENTELNKYTDLLKTYDSLYYQIIAYTSNSDTIKSNRQAAWGSLINTADLNIPRPYDISVTNDGTIIVAGHEGLYAYKYDGNSLTNISFTNETNTVSAMVISPDGTIFSNGKGNLWAHKFIASSFIKEANIIQPENFNDIAIGPNGEIAVARDDGFELYQYANDSFNSIFQYQTGTSDNILSIAIGSDGTIFTANQTDGLHSYLYNGVTIEGVAHVEIDYWTTYTTYLNNIVFAGAGAGQIFAYTYDGFGFTDIASIRQFNADATAIVIDSHNNIYISNDGYGIFVYILEGDKFIEVEHIPYTYNVELPAVAIGQENTIFFITEYGNLRAFEHRWIKYP